MAKKSKIGFVSLGCQKNLVDTEVMLGIVKEQGYELTSARLADIVIINTCCFIKEATKEADDTIKEFSSLRESGAIKKLIVTGCLPQRLGKNIHKSYPAVDHFLGTSDFPYIIGFLDTEKKIKEKVVVGKPDYIYDAETPRVLSQRIESVYIKVSEGCSEQCSFCVIPRIRGRLRSRTIDDIMNEVAALAGQGTKELNLLAQNLTDYGSDLQNGTTLEKLLKELVQIEDLKWIRLLYNYPKNFSDDLISLIAEENKICNYIDLPLQHINDDVLKMMRRKNTKRQIISLLNKLKSSIPDIIFRTSFITGFPTETEKEFNELCGFIKEYEFDKIAIFPYSHEEGTLAYRYGDKISPQVKLERYDELTKIKKDVSLKRNNRFVGKNLTVIVENNSGDKNGKFLEGRFYGQAPEVDGKVIVQTQNNVKHGSFIEARIERADEYDLYGTEKR